MPICLQIAPESQSPLFRRGEERSDEGQSPIYQKKSPFRAFYLILQSLCQIGILGFLIPRDEIALLCPLLLLEVF
jgi:hypothetical protein